jgi:hypothetical protein
MASSWSEIVSNINLQNQVSPTEKYTRDKCSRNEHIQREPFRCPGIAVDVKLRRLALFVSLFRAYHLSGQICETRKATAPHLMPSYLVLSL